MAEGKSQKEAVRSLKRPISNAVYLASCGSTPVDRRGPERASRDVS